MKKTIIRTAAMVLACTSVFSAAACGTIDDEDERPKHLASDALAVEEDSEEASEDTTEDETGDVSEDETDDTTGDTTEDTTEEAAEDVTADTTESETEELTGEVTVSAEESYTAPEPDMYSVDAPAEQEPLPASIPKDAEHIRVGETYILEDKLMLTVTSVEETSYRDDWMYGDPQAVYQISYTYSNLGIDKGLYINLSDMIVDSASFMGTECYLNSDKYPYYIPVGATCNCTCGVAVDNPGDFSIVIKARYDDYNLKANAVIDVDLNDHNKYTAPANPVKFDTSSSLHVGDTWSVPGQWDLTINNVEQITDAKHSRSNKSTVLYKINYTYTNTGYSVRYADGLYINVDSMPVDKNGVLGYPFLAGFSDYPTYTAVNETCTASQIVELDTPGEFSLILEVYGSDKKSHTAVFTLTP